MIVQTDVDLCDFSDQEIARYVAEDDELWSLVIVRRQRVEESRARATARLTMEGAIADGLIGKVAG